MDKSLAQYRLDLMSAKQAAEYLQRNDLAVLPVGCFEMHGPLLPLGTDTIHTWACGLLLAELWDAVCFPPIQYVYPGASGPWPGTIDISPEESTAYIKAVAKAAIKGGFKRLVLCGSHGPLGFMFSTIVRGIYQETGDIVLALSPYQPCVEAIEKEFGRGGEDLKTVASLSLLGWDKICCPVAKEASDVDGAWPFPEMGGLKKMGVSMPWTFNADSQHTGIKSDYTMDDAPRMAAAMRQAIREHYAELPQLFSSYKEKMAVEREDPPWWDPKIWTNERKS